MQTKIIHTIVKTTDNEQRKKRGKEKKTRLVFSLASKLSRLTRD